MSVSARHRQELLAVTALLLGVFVGLALLPFDFTGPLGRIVGRSILLPGLGSGALILPVFGVAVGLAGFGWLGGFDVRRTAILSLGLVLLVPYAIGVFTGVRAAADFGPDWAEWSLTRKAVGVIPGLLVIGVRNVIGWAGAVALGVLGVSALTIVTVDWNPFRRVSGQREDGRRNGRTGGREDVRRTREREEDEEDQEVLEPLAPKPKRERKPKAPDLTSSRPHVLTSDLTSSRPHVLPSSTDPDLIPPVDLLDPAVDEGASAESEIEHMGQVLMETLQTFRVDGKIVGRTTGPVVTQYEVAPAPGVKVNRIASLADDLALAMKAQSIRIVAPIPGKAAVGVEVPNPTARVVRIRELLDAAEWNRARGDLPIALGRDLEGRTIVADLAKMPHLLIAGATGSGKSVCINTIITSLVYRYTPADLRMLMIDPKMVELAGYNAFPHLRHAVVTNNRDAAQTLKWAVFEMERRYQLFSANGARNVKDFNRKVADGREMVLPIAGGGKKTVGDGSGVDGGQLTLPGAPYTEGKLPYIVLFVDELADLMMTVQGDVEKPLALLAQKARATGIHIILATQRPSVNVVTGLIKANFPCRIAFRVASKVDSRTILDQNGAEALLGNGDMLFLPPGKSEPVRIQGAFISTEETERLTEWFTEQKRKRAAALTAQGLVPEDRVEIDILEQIAAQQMEEEGGGAAGAAEGAEGRDSLFREAAEVCIQHQLGSTSLLQRKLRIGYGRAARIIDQLHEAGILGPPDGSKPREVLIGPGQLDEYCS
jgi:DNA segregation ATPase FtsK/SpoIIIE, S-DNA-T family